MGWGVGGSVGSVGVRVRECGWQGWGKCGRGCEGV